MWEVQSNILSGHAGDGVPSAAGTIELPACLKGTASSIEHTDTQYRNTGLAVCQTYTQPRRLDVNILRVSEVAYTVAGIFSF